ncbi:MAG: DciA family protein [Gammaproteobacteria bacterium]|nr:DciA family protein [Gammaproteobacteria bacterium]
MKISSKDHLTGVMMHSHNGLAQIFKAYRVHQDLASQFMRDIGGEWASELHFVLYRAGVLTLSVKTTSMRMRMKYEKSALIEMLRQKKNRHGLKDIKIQVAD